MADIQEAIEALERLIDPKSGSCPGMDDRARDQARNFIGCWVLPRLRKLRHYGRGGKFSPVNDIALDARGGHLDEEEDL
jgi:hypothetical protein